MAADFCSLLAPNSPGMLSVVFCLQVHDCSEKPLLRYFYGGTVLGFVESFANIRRIPRFSEKKNKLEWTGLYV